MTTYSYHFSLHSTTADGVRYIGDADALFLCLGPVSVMFLSYFFQKQSMFTDVPTKHLVLIAVVQLVTFIQYLLHFWSLWSLGIVLKSIVNLLSIVFITIAEKAVFHKKLFGPDYFGIFLLILSVLWLTPKMLAEPRKSSKRASTASTFDPATGFMLEMANCLCGTFTNLSAEFICKIDYVREMNRHFGSAEAAQKHMIPGRESMTSAFWLGINGVMALPLCTVLILSASFIPNPEKEGESLVDLKDFGAKMLGNKWLIALFIGSTVLLYFKFYTATEVQIYVSSVAKKLLKSFSTIPCFVINLFIATNPRDGGKHLDSFDYRLWTEWCLIISFLFSTMGVLVYYEIAVPVRWKRGRQQSAHKSDGRNPNEIETKSPITNVDGEQSAKRVPSISATTEGAV